jgi:hypothetical protein
MGPLDSLMMMTHMTPMVAAGAPDGPVLNHNREFREYGLVATHRIRQPILIFLFSLINP